MWEDLRVFIVVLLAICGGISAILTAWEKLGKLFHPYKELEDIVAEHGRRLDAHDKMFVNDNRRLEDHSKLAKRIYQVNLALLNHFIDGNGVDHMKVIREELQNDLIETDW